MRPISVDMSVCVGLGYLCRVYSIVHIFLLLNCKHCVFFLFPPLGASPVCRQIRVGVFATDASYWQFYLGYAGVNISLSYTGGTGDLNVLAEPQNCGAGAGEVDCSDYALVILPRWAWFRNGKTTISNSTGTIALTPMGMPTRTITMTHPPSDYEFPQLEGCVV